MNRGRPASTLSQTSGTLEFTPSSLFVCTVDQEQLTRLPPLLASPLL